MSCRTWWSTGISYWKLWRNGLLSVDSTATWISCVDSCWPAHTESGLKLISDWFTDAKLWRWLLAQRCSVAAIQFLQLASNERLCIIGWLWLWQCFGGEKVQWVTWWKIWTGSYLTLCLSHSVVRQHMLGIWHVGLKRNYRCLIFRSRQQKTAVSSSY